jgi:hypothetical protein
MRRTFPAAQAVMCLGALLLVAAAVAVAVPAAAASQHRASCPGGYDTYPVPQSEAELRQLERIDAGLDADPAPYTVAELLELAQLIDANGDGTFCLKAVSNLRGSSGKKWAHF